ncbi:alkaline phosphatase family protein, partial [candidate division WOR-3 bacterium]|nr:alkaline phosphatase family protein [candidate division WOR-3 bacterium]
MRKKLIVFGLDCVPPSLLFEKWKDKLPVMKSIIDASIYGPLRTIMPPITIPAWMSMLTSKNPGRLGCYGFRSRKGYSYNDIQIANSRTIRERKVWEILGEFQKKVIILGVPQTYPPYEINGILVSGFMTPSTDTEYTFPRELKQDIKTKIGDYKVDVKDFRTDKKDYVKKQILDMTEKRFKLFKFLLSENEWDFAMVVEMGTDRMHHAFWKYLDPTHSKYTPDSPYSDVIFDYYRLIDNKIGEILDVVPEETGIMIVSDHGAKRMDGCFAINEWFLKNGYLKLKSYPDKPQQFSKLDIDWKNTKAWGWGGYYGRIFINLKGRERFGTVDRNDFGKVLEDIKNGIFSDAPKETVITRPDGLYPEVRGNPPDLMAFFGDLYYRSVSSVGYNKYLTDENDTGPDDAMHDYDGVFVLKNGNGGKKLDNLNIKDVAPTILMYFYISPPHDMEG